MNYETIRPGAEGSFSKEQIADFLYNHLDEFGDPKEDILKCIDYALSEEPNMGGFIIVASENDKILGATIINKTAMKDYIPPNILVYIAVHEQTRGKGVGKQIMQKAFEEAEGDVALHVEPNNPAKFLYEKVGMTNKYLEYRYKAN